MTDKMIIKANGVSATFAVPVDNGCYIFPDRASKLLSSLPKKGVITLSFAGHVWTIPPDTIPQIKAVVSAMKKGDIVLFAEVERLLK